MTESRTYNETGLDAMAGDGGYKEEKYLGNYLRFKMKREGKRFWAGDNISEYIDNEHAMSKFIPRDMLVELETVGLTGNIAPNGMMIID